jgi:hypothetical protein
MKRVLWFICCLCILMSAQSLTITMPDGGEQWIVGNKHPIHWDWSGSMPSVKLEYTTDGGTNWNLIASSSTNDGDYLWTIPNNVTANCFVKISDAANPSIYDLSDASFSINRPTIDIKNPDGGEILQIGEYFPIHWDWTGQFSNVRIEYSTDAGSSWIQIIASTTNDGEHYWQIPNAPSDLCQVKITNLTDPACFDVSDNNFTIASNTITVLQPNGSEAYTIGQVDPVYWDWSGSFTNAKIEYSTDNGGTWLSVATSTQNDGSYNWTVPNTPSTSCRTRVSDASNASCFDVSDNNFTILATGLHLTAPNGGETCIVGDLCPIHWEWMGTISSVKIEYSSDGGGTWNQIIASTTNDGDYIWNVPNIPTTQCRIKITNVADANCWDISDANFTVQSPSFTIFDPDSGKSLIAGETYPVHWNWKGDVSSVKLELWYKIAGGVNWWTITSSTTNDGSHYFTVPYYISDSCWIKITSNDDANCFALSEVFEIVRPTIRVVYPNGGEQLTEGSKFEVIWDWNGNFSSVQLQYSVDSANWQQIIASTANDGSYAWTVPSGVYNGFWIKVINTADIDDYDISDAACNISSDVITVMRPASADNYFIKHKHPIYWKCLGNFPTAQIRYSTNGGGTWNTVTASTPNTGCYLWTCDTLISSNARIAVISNLNTGTFDYSDIFSISDTFSLTQPIHVLAPVTNDTFAVGDTCYITWHSQTFAPPNQVNLSYSISGPAGPWINIATVSNSQRSYAWIVPNYLLDSCYVQIADVNGSAAQTSAPFSITIQQIKVISPTSVKEWIIGRKYFILWQYIGNFSNAVIDYSYDGGATWVSIVSPTSNDGEYEWTIPNTPSIQSLIRIRNYENSNVVAISDTFAIIPQGIFVSYPIVSDSFLIGRKYYVTWDYTGTFSMVNIEYSTDGGLTWTQSASGVTNNQYYEWTIPNAPTNLAVVRIINSANLNAVGRSDTFSIIPQTIEVTSPAFNSEWIVGRKYYVSWRYTGAFPSAKIEYSHDNGNVWNTIVETVTNSGNYEWTIPNTPSDSCFVRVLNYSNLNVYDISARFRIPLQTITITSPKENDALLSGRKYYITWYWLGTITQVNIQYSTDNGVTWDNIASNVTNNGYYEWTIPTANAESCFVRLINAANPNASDISEMFSIVTQQIIITSPVSQDTLLSGRKYYLTWRTRGSFSNADLSYSLDGGQTWTGIVTNVANSGYYEWNMPEITSNLTRIKIANNAQPSVFANSDTFMIAPPILEITSPASGNLWYATRKYYITWNQLGVIAQVNLSYSLDGGGSWNQIIANQTNQGNYEWTIPTATQSQDAQIRLTNSTNSSISYFSDSFVITVPGVEELAGIQLPTEFAQCFVPNPFSERGVIKLAVPCNSKISLVTYDVCGRVVDNIFDSHIEAGYHSFDYDSDLPCGIYFLRFEAHTAKEEYVQTIKILKTK